MGKKMTKVTLNLPQDIVDQIKKWAEERHTNATEVIKQAIRSEKFFDTQEKNKSSILIQEENSTALKQVIFQR